MSKSKEKKTKEKTMFKTVEMMAKISGIGENTLRNLMEDRQISYVQIGNKRLLTEADLLEWYNRNKVAVKTEG